MQTMFLNLKHQWQRANKLPPERWGKLQRIRVTEKQFKIVIWVSVTTGGPVEIGPQSNQGAYSNGWGAYSNGSPPMTLSWGGVRFFFSDSWCKGAYFNGWVYGRGPILLSNVQKSERQTKQKRVCPPRDAILTPTRWNRPPN